MNGVLLVAALAQALRVDAPDRDAVWMSLLFAIRDGKLLSQKKAECGPEEIQAAIRGSISRGSFRPGWLEACETALLQSPIAWLNYVESHGHTVTAAQKIRQLLRLHAVRPDLIPAPFFAPIVSIIEDIQAELTPTDSAKCATAHNGSSFNAPSPVSTTMPTPTALPLTRSQRSAYERLCAMAEVYFQPPSDSPISARLTPLLIGPSGAGKSALAKQIAQATGSHIMRVSLSTWIPSGAKDTPTLRRIGQTLNKYERVVLIIDEVDKLSSDTGSWARSCATEIYDLLERECSHLLTDCEGERKTLERKLRSQLFLIAAGSWQHLQNRRTNTRGLGFGAACESSPKPPPDITALAIAEGYPIELFGRFHTNPVLLDYPDSAETAEILDRMGLHALAELAGRRDLVERFTWQPFGMRALESLYTDLLLIRKQQTANTCRLGP